MVVGKDGAIFFLTTIVGIFRRHSNGGDGSCSGGDGLFPCLAAFSLRKVVIFVQILDGTILLF